MYISGITRPNFTRFLVRHPSSWLSPFSATFGYVLSVCFFFEKKSRKNTNKLFASSCYNIQATVDYYREIQGDEYYSVFEYATLAKSGGGNYCLLRNRTVSMEASREQ